MYLFLQGLCAFLALAVTRAQETLARHLQSQGKDHIWGSCGQVVSDYGVPACTLLDGVCSNRISGGPAHADLEVVIGNLPKPSAEGEVHVAWWAPYESSRAWKPLESPDDVSIHPNMDLAYPKWYDVEFNGGNVQVDEAGQATIRVRSMATYLHQQRVVRPHIHLRVCRGEDVVLDFDHIAFGTGEQWVETHSQGEAIQVLSARHIENPGEAPANYNVPWVDPSLEGALVLATGEIDPAALESSPIYQCLVQNQHYSHFSGSCVDTCPAGSKDLEGECVKGGYTGVVVTLQESWSVEIQCSGSCPTIDAALLHTIRIAVAGYLKISYQEVQVAAAYLRTPGRRLSEDPSRSTLLFTVKVATARHSQEEGAALLEQMLVNSDAASALLKFEVVSISESTEDAFEVEEPSEPSDDSPWHEELLDLITSNRDLLIACACAVAALVIIAFALYKLRQNCKEERKRHQKRQVARAAQLRRAASLQRELEQRQRRQISHETVPEIPEEM